MTGSSRGETRASQVPGPSSSCVPWSNTPPGASLPSPIPVRSLLPSGRMKPSAPGISFLSWLHCPRPTRSRTYASPHRVTAKTAQGSLPARVDSPLAGRVSHPLDD